MGEAVGEDTSGYALLETVNLPSTPTTGDGGEADSGVQAEGGIPPADELVESGEPSGVEPNSGPPPSAPEPVAGPAVGGGGFSGDGSGGESIADITKQYAIELQQTVQALAKRFGEDLTSTMQEYRQRITEIPQNLIFLKDNTVEALQDMTPFQADTAKMMMSYAWTALMLLTMGVCYSVSRYLLAPVVGLLFSPFSCFLSAYVVLPAVLFVYLARPGKARPGVDMDRTRRHYNLGFAAAEGLLTGMLFRHVALASWAPVAALTAAIVMLVLSYGHCFVGNDRTKLLPVALGGGLAAHLAWGLVTGFSFAYILLALLYTVAAFITVQLYIQLYIKNATEEQTITPMYQTLFVYMVLLSDLVVMGLLSGSKEEVIAVAEAPPAEPPAAPAPPSEQ